MTDWYTFAYAVLIAAVVLMVPGTVLGLALRLRGWWLVAAAAPLSGSLIVVSAVLGGWLGTPWTALPVLALTAVAVVAALAWDRWVGRREEPPAHRFSRRGLATGIVALTAGLVPIALAIVRAIGDPTSIAQRYDNFFHLNAVQFVLDTGNASPFWVGSMTAPGNLLFYPSGWHAVASLVAQLAGTEPAIATNALILVVAALVWPLSVVLLARTLFGGSALVTVAAGALAAAAPAFPYLPLHYGPLYPLFLGLALAPVGVAAIIRMLRPGRWVNVHNEALLWVLLIPGIAVSHPGALLAVLALGAPAAFLLSWWLWRASDRVTQRLWIALGVVGLGLAAILVLRVIRPPASEIYWPVTTSLSGAIGEIVTAAVFGYPVAYLFAALVGVGVARGFLRPTYNRTLALGMGFVAAVLYVVVAGSPFETLRLWLTGPWYNNTPRLASIWVLAATPLAALGAAYLVQTFLRWVKRWRLPRQAMRHVPRLVGLLLLAVFLVALSQTGALRQARADLHYVYGDDGEGPILSQGEYELLKELDELVPVDAVIAGNPWTGTSFAYGISGRRVLMPHLLMDESDSAREINRSFKEVGGTERMCQALNDVGVEYILDFDGPDLMENEGGFEGVTDLRGSPNVELVHAEAGAYLYKITTCELTQ